MYKNGSKERHQRRTNFVIDNEVSLFVLPEIFWTF